MSNVVLLFGIYVILDSGAVSILSKKKLRFKSSNSLILLKMDPNMNMKKLVNSFETFKTFEQIVNFFFFV